MSHQNKNTDRPAFKKASDLSMFLYWLERAAAQGAQIKHIFLPEDGDVNRIHVTWYADEVDPKVNRVISAQLTELHNLPKEESVARIKRAIEAVPQLYSVYSQKKGLGTTVSGMCLRDNRFKPDQKALVIFALTYFCEDMGVDYFDLKVVDDRVSVSLPPDKAYDVGRRPALVSALLEFLNDTSAANPGFWDEKDDTKRVARYIKSFQRFEAKTACLRISRKAKTKTDNRPVIAKPQPQRPPKPTQSERVKAQVVADRRPASITSGEDQPNG
jgi:hypothetical protein